MFGMGMSEILIICAVALLVFGPQQLPEMAKKIAKGLKEVRKASDDLKRSINLDDDDDRPRWKPVERPPLLEPTQTATLTPMPVAEPPASITGSALATESTEPVIAAASSSVAKGASLDDGADRSEETTDPQKPSLKEAG
jgi:TatA/E family protein of Tat protein translocase